MNFGEGAGTEFATARGRDWPSVRQFNVFNDPSMSPDRWSRPHFSTSDVSIFIARCHPSVSTDHQIAHPK